MQYFNKITRCFLPAILFMFAGCSSQAPVVSSGHISKIDTDHPVLYYLLPRTVVAVDVTVKKTTVIPGPYAGYAEQLLGLGNVIFSPSSNFEIAGVDINGFAEPDPSQLYYISIPQMEEQKHDFYLSLSEEGLIKSVNTPFDGEMVAGKPDQSKDYGDFGTDATFNYFIDINLMEQVDTIVEHIRMDTLTLQRQTLRRSWVEKSEELRAREVANYILEIREKKFDLISGFQEINYSKEALEYMYKEMDRLENDYLDLFTGITYTQFIRYRFMHTPGGDHAGQGLPLFYFSSSDGISLNDEGNATEVKIHYQASGATAQLKSSLNQRLFVNPTQRAGFYFRIPEYADVQLHIGTKKRAEARMLVNQFGVVSKLPYHQQEIQYYPGTGSIHSVREIPGEDE